MRGEVLRYDDSLGVGLISGDDGARYEFRRSDLQQLRPVFAGMRVDFVANANAATDIYILESAATPQGTERRDTALLLTTNEDLDLWGYFMKCMRKSFNGEGRARRKEYWSLAFFQTLYLLAMVLVFWLISRSDTYDDYYYNSSSSGLLALGMIVVIAIFVPAGITVTVRRLLDIGLSGWFILLGILPYLGGIFLLVVSLIPSERRVNAHGPYPKPLDAFGGAVT